MLQLISKFFFMIFTSLFFWSNIDNITRHGIQYMLPANYLNWKIKKNNCWDIGSSKTSTFCLNWIIQRLVYYKSRKWLDMKRVHQILCEKPSNVEWKTMRQIQLIHFNKIKITTLKIMPTTLVLNKSGKI